MLYEGEEALGLIETLGMVPAIAESTAETEAAPQITSKTFPVYNKTVESI